MKPFVNEADEPLVPPLGFPEHRKHLVEMRDLDPDAPIDCGRIGWYWLDTGRPIMVDDNGVVWPEP